MLLLLLLPSPLFSSVASPRRRDITTTPNSLSLHSHLHSSYRAATITSIYKRNHHSLQRPPSLHCFAQPPPFRILSSLSSLQTVLLLSPLSLSAFNMSLENARLNSTKNVIGIKSNPILSYQPIHQEKKDCKEPPRKKREKREEAQSEVGAGLSKEGEANVVADGADITTGNRDGTKEQKCLPGDQLCLSVSLLLPVRLPSPLFSSVAETSLQLLHRQL